MDEAWKLVLINQFHDIIPGSSIQRVYEEAEADYARVLATAAAVTAQATAVLALDQEGALTVFNSLSWARKVLVPLPEGWAGAKGTDGLLTTQAMDGATYVEVEVPACGWTTIHATDPLAMASGLQATPTRLENELLRITFNERGEITSLYDKEAGRELAAGTCNAIKMYKDVPTNWDAWDLDSMYEDTPVALDAPATIAVLDEGPLAARIQIRRPLHDSEMTQTITLRRGSRRVDFHTVIDWNESHKLLKVNFPVDVYNTEALHEIQFGHIARPTHKSRPFDADRFEVCNHKWTALVEGRRGCAVLNDSKYGVNVDGNSINLTLLKSALAPDMYADKGRQEFTYAFYAWNDTFFESGLVQEGYDLNVAPVTAAGAGGTGSILAVDAPNVIVETVKPAEDGSGDVVVRLYEAMRTATRCTLSTSLAVSTAAETDMLEAKVGDLEIEEGRIALDFRPFEIKTVRLSR
jgi:alpha-mannosidase